MQQRFRIQEYLLVGVIYGILGSDQPGKGRCCVRSEAMVEHWDRSTLPEAGELRKLMEKEGLRPYSWSNGPGYRYATHSHTYDKVIFVASGSITFTLLETDEKLDLEPGDRLHLPAGVLHGAVVGQQGVLCLEAQRLPK